MDSPLLITGSCSHGDSFFSEYREKITVWPELLAKDLKCELLNTAVAGMSNAAISAAVMDAIMNNLDRDITVAVLWTSGERCNVFDLLSMRKTDNEHSIENYLKKLLDWNLNIDDQFQIDEKILNYNLRSIWTLNYFCKNMNIPILNRQSYSLINSIYMMSAVGTYGESKEKILEKERIHKLIEAAKNSKWFIDYHDWRNGFDIAHIDSYLLPDGHPNQKGMEWIAKDFLTSPTNKNYAKTKKSPVFVYE